MPVSGPAAGAAPEFESRTSILVVDDIAEKLLVFRTILEDLGQDLVFVRSGSEALAQVLKREFAVILLDVNMPDIDGFETAALIRRYKRSAHTPIIFVTAYADEMQTARGYSLGAVDYIQSPVVPEVLRSKVKVFVELNLMQQQVRRRADEKIALAEAEAARQAAEQSTRRADFLSDASRRLGASLDLGSSRRALLELLVPEVGNSAAVLLVDDAAETVPIVHCESRGIRSEPTFSEITLKDLAPSLQDGFERALRTRTRVSIGIQAPVETFSGGSAPQWLPQARTLVVPLATSQGLLGAVSVSQRAGPVDEALLDELANRAAIAFENARLYGSLQSEILERQQAEATLQEANQRKDEFLAMLSHELRNPLAPIRNAVAVMRRLAPADAKLAWATEVTERQVDHLTRLIEELLDVARISQGKIELNLEPVDMLAVIAQGVETARPLIDARHHTLALKLPDGPVWLRGDCARLAQVVANLLNNAAKYTDDGGSIQLTLSVDNGVAVISVRDNGMGIDADLLPLVFDLFRQGKRSLDRGQGGLGVGLTLVQRLVVLHGGHVEALSGGAGLGAEFRVTLPCLTEVRTTSGASARADDTSAPKGCRVLVVDDSADSAETVAVYLELAGHEVKAVTDAHQALSCAPIYAPDVVILDIGLPGIDGYELARQLRKMEPVRNALLIAMTGYGQDADKAEALRAGFDHHLVKPADPAALLGLIGNWRAAGRNPAQPARAPLARLH